MDITDLITNPDRFFGNLKSKDANLKKPALIVLTLAIIIAYYQFRLAMKLSTALPADLVNFFKIGAYVNVIGTVFGVFATWLIAAVIMHGLSAFFDGKGEFRRTFEFTGYGFLPSLCGSAITVPVTLSYVEKAVVPEIDVRELAANPEIIVKSVLNQIPTEYVHSTLLLNLAVTVWGLLIWTFAVKNARDVEVGKALVCAVVPTVVFSSFQILSVLKMG